MNPSEDRRAVSCTSPACSLVTISDSSSGDASEAESVPESTTSEASAASALASMAAQAGSRKRSPIKKTTQTKRARFDQPEPTTQQEFNRLPSPPTDRPRQQLPFQQAFDSPLTPPTLPDQHPNHTQHTQFGPRFEQNPQQHTYQ
jgi:hypothetical protein